MSKEGLMKKVLFAALFSLLLLGGLQVAFAEDCVQVDIELPENLVSEAATFADGSISLTNCGDVAATITVDFDVTMIFDFNFADESYYDTVNFDVDIDVPVDAGETISREFSFPITAFSGTATIEVCVTATSGTAEAVDCATMTVEGTMPGNREREWERSGSPRFNFVFTGQGCVEADLELPDTIYAGNQNQGSVWNTGYFELTNCSDEPAQIMLGVEASISVGDFVDTSIIFPDHPVVLGAGETVSREFRFHTPPFDGVYTICVTATSGEAVAAACQTMVVVGAQFPGVLWSTCGSLVQGTDCILYSPHCDPSKLFVLDNYGDFQAGDAVCVEGTLDVKCETECSDAVGCVLDNTITAYEPPSGAPFAGCGVLTESGTCVLFAVLGQSGFMFLLDNYGDFQVGDTVYVEGTMFGDCDLTECPDAKGCIVENTIDVCGQTPASAVDAIEAQNFPNPFNPTTNISFTLPVADQVTVTVYNLLGRQVKVLLDGYLGAGEHSVQWDGTDSDGGTVSSGMYFYRIAAGQHSVTRKMVLTK